MHRIHHTTSGGKESDDSVYPHLHTGEIEMTRKCNRCGMKVNMMTYWSHECRDVSLIVPTAGGKVIGKPSKPSKVLIEAYESNTEEE